MPLNAAADLDTAVADLVRADPVRFDGGVSTRRSIAVDPIGGRLNGTSKSKPLRPRRGMREFSCA